MKDLLALVFQADVPAPCIRTMWTTKATGSGFGCSIARDSHDASWRLDRGDRRSFAGARFRVLVPAKVIRAA